ncbi:hypothetical protein CO674_27550 [Rhizobium hidalgonense]|uniref:Uncharacterized protein n=1 Tax=Rhizobium hidalgonense TaxID=1538159 RepID=A0ABX4JNQ9_9HYPH|nr:hypothetical protein CO674_27550 [Rhizobium hidalgonense]
MTLKRTAALSPWQDEMSNAHSDDRNDLRFIGCPILNRKYPIAEGSIASNRQNTRDLHRSPSFCTHPRICLLHLP